MQPFTRVSGPAAPFTAPNVDTDIIMPKQFLKTSSCPSSEPLRDCRRLQLLRDWSHDEEGIDEIRT